MLIVRLGRRAWSLVAMTSAVALTAAVPAQATQVSYRTLEQVVADSPLVFTAEVARANPTDTPSERITEYEIRDVRALRGTLPNGTSRVRNTQPLPVVRDSSGKIVMEVSFTLDASGHEREATSGRWIFFGVAAATAPLAVRRVEPIASEAKVRALLQSPGDASLPAAPTTSPDDPPPPRPPPPPVPPAPVGRSSCATTHPAPSGGTSNLAVALGVGALFTFVRRRRPYDRRVRVAVHVRPRAV